MARGAKATRALAPFLVCALALFSVRAAGRQGPATAPYRLVPTGLDPIAILGRVTELELARNHFPTPRDPIDNLDRYVSTVWSRLGLPDRWSGRCPICDSELVDELSRFVVFRLQVESWVYRFVVFYAPEQPGDAWRLAGFADTDAKYDMPAYHLASIRGRTFLVIEHDTGGTGTYESGESWVDLTSGTSVEVLTLPIKGHDEFLPRRADGPVFAIGHEWQVAITHRPDPEDPALRVSLSVRYTMSDLDGSDVLFARTQSAAFAWDQANGRFRFDASRSDLTQAEFEAVYAAERLDAASLVKYNIGEVGHIAAQGTQREKRAFAALGVTAN